MVHDRNSEQLPGLLEPVRHHHVVRARDRFAAGGVEVGDEAGACRHFDEGPEDLAGVDGTASFVPTATVIGAVTSRRFVSRASTITTSLVSSRTSAS